MSKYNNRWNIPQTYPCARPEMIVDSGLRANLGYVPFEHTEHLKPFTYDPPHVIDRAIEDGTIDNLCVEIICRVACSKYLTLSQLHGFLTMQGLEYDTNGMQKRLKLLVRGNFLRTLVCKVNSNVTLKCFTLGFNGNDVAFRAGIFMHKGLAYQSVKRRIDQGLSAEDAPYEIKRVLQANHILLSCLRAGVDMERFGIQETIRTPDGGVTDSILRTTCTVRLDSGNHLLVEVVRRHPEWQKGLLSKVGRLSRMTHRADFLECVNVGLTALPQLVVCGEDEEHNMEIHQLLQQEGAYVADPDLTLLFTTDPLSVQAPGMLYAITPTGDKEWYSLPLLTDRTHTAA